MSLPRDRTFLLRGVGERTQDPGTASDSWYLDSKVSMEGGGHTKSMTVWGMQHLLSETSIVFEVASCLCSKNCMYARAGRERDCYIYYYKGELCITPNQIGSQVKFSPRQMFIATEVSG